MLLPQEICKFVVSRCLRLAAVSTIILIGLLPSAGQVTANPAALNFGDVPIGTKPTLPVVLTNNGSSTVSITKGQVQGRGFAVIGVKLPIVLNPGQNFTINTTFAPLVDGPYSGQVSGFGSSGPLVNVPVNGNGTQSGYSVNLSWDPSSSQVVGYNVYRGLKSGGPYGKINPVIDTSTAYSDYTVASATTYYYVTTAVDSSGHESAYSNQTQAVIP